MHNEDLDHVRTATRHGPHHLVVKMIGENIKMNMVFDASAKYFASSSLNDWIYTGLKYKMYSINRGLNYMVLASAA